VARSKPQYTRYSRFDRAPTSILRHLMRPARTSGRYRSQQFAAPAHGSYWPEPADLGDAQSGQLSEGSASTEPIALASANIGQSPGHHHCEPSANSAPVTDLASRRASLNMIFEANCRCGAGRTSGCRHIAGFPAEFIVWRSSLHTQRVRMLSIYRDPHGSIRSDDSRTLPPEVIWIDLLNPTDEEKAFVEKHGDDQASTGALRVIERVEDMGNVPGAGTTTRQRSHDHTIFAVQRTNREWTEKIDQLHLPRACRDPPWKRGRPHGR
jgi:hypothetical protein